MSAAGQSDGIKVGSFKAGEHVWVRVSVCGTGHKQYTVQPLVKWAQVTSVPVTDILPDSPQLPVVARWLAEYGIETLHSLVDAGVWCLDVGGGIEFDDPAEQVRVIAAGRSLLAALAVPETTEGGGR